MGKKYLKFFNLFIAPYALGQHFTKHINKNSIEYWQAFIFYAIFSFILFIGFFMYAPNSFFAIRDGSYHMAIIYASFYGLLIGLILYPKFSIRRKTAGISILIYILSIFVLKEYGPAGSGLTFLFIIVLLCSLFIGIRSSLSAAGINFVTCQIFVWLYYTGKIHWEYIHNISVSPWLMTNVNILIVQVIFAFAISQLIYNVKKTFSTINKTKEATIIGLAKLAEYKDMDTGRHLDRICEYASLITSALSKEGTYKHYITRQYIDDIFISSTLHDIGKVGIPDSILLKPGKLESQEFEFMKRHSIFGKQVIEEISNKLGDKSFLDMACCIAHYHHEKWDGTGYPDGLKEEKIPLSARIVSIADVYDALTTKRVYKDAFSHDKAMEIIKSERGKHFDPNLTDIFILLNEKFNTIRLKHNDSD